MFAKLYLLWYNSRTIYFLKKYFIMSSQNKTVEHEQPKKIFDYVVIALVVIGLVGFYVLHAVDVVKWLVFVLSIVGAGVVFFFLSPTGLRLHGYFLDSWRELKKVAWPTNKETLQFMWIVLIFVFILGLFLWGLDTAISWLLYHVILGKGA